MRRSGLRLLDVLAAIVALALGGVLWPLIRSIVAQVGAENTVATLIVLVIASGLYRWLSSPIAPTATATAASAAPIADGLLGDHAVLPPISLWKALLAEYHDDLLVEHAIARASSMEISDIRDQIELLKQQDSRTEESSPDDRNPDSVERRARHEAAHAVVALATGASIRRASVGFQKSAGGTVLGGIVESVAPLADPRVRVWTLLRINLAGQALDLRNGYRDSTSSLDMANVERHAQFMVSADLRPPGFSGELTVSALIDAARADVEAILNDHADAVSRIARLLAENADQGGILRDPDLRPLFELSANQKTSTH